MVVVNTSKRLLYRIDSYLSPVSALLYEVSLFTPMYQLVLVVHGVHKLMLESPDFRFMRGQLAETFLEAEESYL